MEGKKLRKVFVSIISTITVLTGALLGTIPTGADLSFAAGNPKDDKQIVKIASWYTEEDLKYLKAYLAEQFPDYTFEFEYVDKSNYEDVPEAISMHEAYTHEARIRELSNDREEAR